MSTLLTWKLSIEGNELYMRLATGMQHMLNEDEYFFYSSSFTLFIDSKVNRSVSSTLKGFIFLFLAYLPTEPSKPR